MPKRQQTPTWQDVRRTLASKSKTELLNLVRDLYALNPENQNVIQAQALAPKAPPRAKASAKATQQSQVSKVAPKIRRLAQIAAELRQGENFEVTRLTTLKSLCEDSKAGAQCALHLSKVWVACTNVVWSKHRSKRETTAQQQGEAVRGFATV